MYSRRALVLPLLGVILFSLSAFAGDPPGRVARLDYMTGQVSIQPNGVNEWVAANINRPLTTSDRIWTDKDSRAELQMGAASARLNSDTSLTLANVSDNAVQLQLDQGTLNLHVIRLFDGEIYEIDTPNLAFTVEKPGDYRFDVDNAGDTTVVTVWKGRGVATGDNPGVVIKAHQQLTFRGGRTLNYIATNAPGFDGFDSWCRVRSEREDDSPSLRYVSPYYVGYSDLDNYGYWETVPTYGAVWVPRGVAYGWAPYRWGHWVYIAPWGWTWVDDEPWGFAPFHYGRWVYFGNRWGWCPGPIAVRPIWAPALVAWVGGPHWGVGLSFGIGGGVGWFPLGWGEPYIPWYGASRGYFQNVNVSNTHITNITYITKNYYGNAHPVRPIQYINRHPDRITAVSNAVFTGSRPTRNSYVPVSAQAMNGARVIRDVPVRPTRESMTGPGERTAPPPSRAFSRPVVTNMRPPEASRPSAATAGIERPGRNGAPVVTERPAPVASTPADRPSRGYSRPTDNRTPAMATEEAPRGIPQPSSSGSNREVSVAPSMPSRVPRPPESLRQPVNQPGSTPEVRSTAPAMPSRNYPRPGEGVTSQPVAQPSVSVRPSREAPNSNLRQYAHPEVTPSPAPQTNTNREYRPSRNEPTYSQPAPRPNVTPAPPPSVSRQERPAARPTETHAPAPAPAQKQSAPSHESRPGRTDNKESPRASVGFPSPYNNSYAPTVRPASMTQSYPRPSGAVAPAPRASNYSAPQNYSARQSYSTRQNYSSRQSYSPAARSYSPNYNTGRNYPSYNTGRSYSSAPRSYSPRPSQYSAPHYSAPRYSNSGSSGHVSRPAAGSSHAESRSSGGHARR